jgi:hypothetical protein
VKQLGRQSKHDRWLFFKGEKEATKTNLPFQTNFINKLCPELKLYLKQRNQALLKGVKSAKRGNVKIVSRETIFKQTEERRDPHKKPKHKKKGGNIGIQKNCYILIVSRETIRRRCFFVNKLIILIKESKSCVICFVMF